MKLERKKLLDALEKLKPGLSPKELVEQMTQFNFLGKHLVTYNEIISVYVPFESDFICSVKADVFQGILSKLNEKNMELNLIDEEVKDEEGETVLIKYNLQLLTDSTEAEFPVLIEGDISKAMLELEKQMDGDWLELPKDFSKGAYLCMFSASKDPADNTLTCLKVDGEHLTCNDNTRATWYRMDGEMEPFLMQAAVAKELKKYFPSHYHVGENWIHFKNESDGTIFNVRRVKGQMKDVRPFFTKEGTDFKVPVELKEAIELAGVVNADDRPLDRLVELSIEKNKAICSAWKDGGAKVKKEVPIPFYSGDEICFFINPDFMMEIIEHSEPDAESKEKAPKMIINMDKRLAYFVNKKFDHALLLRADKK
jgi:hypothetical protein